MIRSRIHYWTCSKFADWIRGEKKPYALEWGEWEKWKEEQRNKRPFRFWLSDSLLSRLQNVVYYPYDVYSTIRIYIRNRYFDKLHYLKTGLKPGEYYDLDERILHGLFNELIIFVEDELAHLSRWDRTKNYKFINGRCVQAGLDHLDWASKLVYNEDYGIGKEDVLYGQITPQAQSAIEIRELYNWWKNIRPNRTEPYDNKNFKVAMKLEDQYDNEDSEMLIRLMKIRKSLWC
jgi:hypothetical protein